MSTTELSRHHVAVFLDHEQSGPVEELRSRWDPGMASQIAAHVTLIYPEEIPDPIELNQLAETAAASIRPFTIALGPPFYVGSPADGVFFRVHDTDGGIGSFRARTVLPVRAIDFPPHVTIVHPRTSSLGEQAWQALAATQLDTQFAITYLAITASDGERWRTIRRLPLAAPSSTLA
jgi:2'-5' RNA ligase superfamily